MKSVVPERVSCSALQKFKGKVEVPGQLCVECPLDSEVVSHICIASIRKGRQGILLPRLFYLLFYCAIYSRDYLPKCHGITRPTVCELLFHISPSTRLHRCPQNISSHSMLCQSFNPLL